MDETENSPRPTTLPEKANLKPPTARFEDENLEYIDEENSDTPLAETAVNSGDAVSPTQKINPEADPKPVTEDTVIPDVVPYDPNKLPSSKQEDQPLIDQDKMNQIRENPREALQNYKGSAFDQAADTVKVKPPRS